MKNIGKNAQYSKSCTNDKKYNCTEMQNSGSCMLGIKKMADVCGATCGNCEKCINKCTTCKHVVNSSCCFRFR